MGRILWTFPWNNEIHTVKVYWSSPNHIQRIGGDIAGHKILYEQPTSNIFGRRIWKKTCHSEHTLRGESAAFIEEMVESLETEDNVSLLMQYLKRNRQYLRKRWIEEYSRALNKMHQPRTGTSTKTLDKERCCIDQRYIEEQWKIEASKNRWSNRWERRNYQRLLNSNRKWLHYRKTKSACSWPIDWRTKKW